MKNNYLLLLAVLCCYTTHLCAQASCSSPLIIDVGTYTVDSIYGAALGPDCTAFENGDRANWYLYFTNTPLDVTISSQLPASEGVDTRLSVLAGNCNGLICVGGSDDNGGSGNSSFSFTTLPGVIYYIVWDNRWTSDGFDFEVTAEEPEPGLIQFNSVSLGHGGSALGAVDMNGDHLDDVVVVNGNGVRVNYQQADGSYNLVDIQSEPLTNFPDWSMAAADYDANGYTDLVFGDGSAVSFMRANEDGTQMTEIPFSEYVFSQRSNFIDINNDGNLDAFVCHDVDPNVFFINDGDNNFSFNQGSLGDTPGGGNYGSIWMDFDNDGDQDLFIAKCRGGSSNPANINQLHRNNGDGTYTEVAEQFNLADDIQTWSSAWGDFDNDGDLDVFVGASSFSNGAHKMMRNDGDTFTDITMGTGLDNLTATNNETITHDFNNDGFLDVLNGGRALMINNGDWTFERVNIPPFHGPVGDLNDDGFLDIVNASNVFFNQPNGNNYLTIATVGTVSNINGIGARIEVYSALGKQIRDVQSGTGFRYMSSLNAHFGLGQDTEIDRVIIRWPSGIIDEILAPEINSTLVVVEGNNPSSTRNQPIEQLSFFPNPAQEAINVPGEWSVDAVAKVFDLNGRLLIHQTFQNNRLLVDQLVPGSYLFILEDRGELKLGRLIKQ